MTTEHGSSLRFGTDGVRGFAYDELTLDLAYRIGRAAAEVFDTEHAVIGMDTRESGPALARALAAGFAAGGCTVGFLGVAPTPAVAFHANVNGSVGAMVSASHNPWHDNGIKLFAAGGRKLSDAEQAALEAQLDAMTPQSADEITSEADRVPMAPLPSSIGAWADSLITSCEPGALAGLHVVIDAANGAGSHVSGPVLADLGARVDIIHAQPDGRNINADCGSTHPQDLASRVVELGADVGIALDGDADRLVAVDAEGSIVDGDAVIAICAIDLAARKRLADDTVVVTVMTNLGFRLAMAERGIEVLETPVGDRHVLAALEEHGLTIGGEQSGHVIFRDLATTGDGLLTAVQLLQVIAASGRSLEALASEAMTRLPQVLRNVRVAQTVPDAAGDLRSEIEAAEAVLGDTGRVLIRASGTEPVVRIMVEAPTSDQADAVCADLVAAAERRFAS